MRPRFTDAWSAGTGFGIDAIARHRLRRGRAIVEESGRRAPRRSSTDDCGLPRNGIVSDGVSHGSIFGCCLKSVNQEHEHNMSGASNAIAFRLAVSASPLTVRVSRCPYRSRRTSSAPCFLRMPSTMLTSSGSVVHEHAVVAAAEARIVAHGHREPRNVRQAEHREHRGQAADQHHHLESENRERHPASRSACRRRRAASSPRSRPESSSRTSRRPDRTSA